MRIMCDSLSAVHLCFCASHSYDPRLTARGRAEAARAANRVTRVQQKPDLIVVSP